MTPTPICGVVYLPSRSGCDLWRSWDRAGTESDLRAIRRQGVHAVRFFIIWRDFEPRPGQYNTACFAHLHELVAIAAQEDLLCIPSILTIFMNGELLDLPWREGRDLWSDSEMIERASAFVARVAATLRHRPNIVAYDIGDEIIHVDAPLSHSKTREQASGWQRRMAEAIRSNHPGARVLQASDASAVFGAHGFTVDNCQALDLHGLHTFPDWAPVPVDGVRDPVSSLLPGFLVRFARPFAQTIVDELGAYGASEDVATGHLRAAGASALAAGADGVFAWCWQDLTSTAPPYDRRPHETRAGLLDATGAPKARLQALHDLINLSELLAHAKSDASPIGVLIPELWAQTGGSYLDSHRSWATAALGTYLLLMHSKLPVEFVRVPHPHTRLLVCPVIEGLSRSDIEQIRRHVEAGGHLFCSATKPLGVELLDDLIGAETRDFTIQHAGRESIVAEGTRYELDWVATGRNGPVALWDATPAATVHAEFEDGTPAMTSLAHGDAVAWFARFPLELQPLSELTGVRSAAWAYFYLHAARSAGIEPAVACPAPWVELRVLPRGLLAINHDCCPVKTTVQPEVGEPVELTLAAKQFAVLPDMRSCTDATPAAQAWLAAKDLHSLRS